MPTYDELLVNVVKIADQYSFGAMITGFTPALINVLMQNHLDKLTAANNYEAAMSLLNAAISSQMGAGVSIDAFITNLGDRRELYTLFAEWRIKLLEEVAM